MQSFIHFSFWLLALQSRQASHVFHTKNRPFDNEPLNFCHCSMFTLPLHAMMDTHWTTDNSAVAMQTVLMCYYVVGDEVKFIHVHSIAFVRSVSRAQICITGQQV